MNDQSLQNYLTLLVSTDLEGNRSLIDDTAVQVMWINNQNGEVGP
jgi:hypothetical protein